MIRFALVYLFLLGVAIGLLRCTGKEGIPLPSMSREDSTRALQRKLQRALDSVECAKYGEPCPPGRP